MKPKYRLTDETKVVEGHILHRIEALKSFYTPFIGRVKIHTKGGWIESENNLSQKGDCWVYGDAIVYGNARVFDSATVGEFAKVYGNAIVCDIADIFGNAEVYDNARVEHAHVYENAHIFGNAKVYDESCIFENAKIYGNSILYCCRVNGEAKVHAREYSPIYGFPGCFWGYDEICDDGTLIEDKHKGKQRIR